MLNVVIAEDNVSVSVHLSNAINTKNVRCIAILNEGTKVYQKIKETKADVLILDLKMPGKNGLQILRQIEDDEELKTKVIIYSGDMEYMKLAREYDFILKFISKLTPYEEVSRQLQTIEDEKTNKGLENKVTDILFKLGFAYSLKGTRLIKECILYSVQENNENINFLYDKVAKNRGCNPLTLKSDINTAVNYMWKYTDREKTRKILRIGEKDKPSTRTVITMVKYYIEK